jgi:hypothetical protein
MLSPCSLFTELLLTELDAAKEYTEASSSSRSDNTVLATWDGAIAAHETASPGDNAD